MDDHLETLRRERPRVRPARRWRDELDDYWKGTIWQSIAQDGYILKHHTDAFAQPYYVYTVHSFTDDDDDDDPLSPFNRVYDHMFYYYIPKTAKQDGRCYSGFATN